MQEWHQMRYQFLSEDGWSRLHMWLLLQIKTSSLTLSKSSSFSETLSSPDSSSKKGFVGSRGVSGFFCWERAKEKKHQTTARLPACSCPSKILLCLAANKHGIQNKVQVWSHPRPVVQGAAREALSQQSFEIGGPLNSEEQKLDLDLPGTGSHQLGQLGSDEQTKHRHRHEVVSET